MISTASPLIFCEVALVLEVLRLTHGRQTQAATLLGLNPATLNCMIKRFGIDAESLAVNPVSQNQPLPRSKKSSTRATSEQRDLV